MIRFVTSIAFANESELGWDPTIQRERIPEQVHSSPGGNSSEPEREQVDATRYRITVHTRPVGDDGHEGPAVETVYRTTRIIFDYGADALRGRGTRVFEARRLEDNVEVGELVVIKDVWVDDDREREDRILSQLLNDADDKDKELVKKYFLTVLACATLSSVGKWIIPAISSHADRIYLEATNFACQLRPSILAPNTYRALVTPKVGMNSNYPVRLLQHIIDFLPKFTIASFSKKLENLFMT